jgi:hypothetical protein
LGSQSRKPGSGRGRRGKSKGGGGGGGGGEGSPTDERRDERVYQKAFKKLEEALASNNFSYAANVAASISISRTPSDDLMSLILAGVKAFSEGKEKAWKPESRTLADSGIQFAREKTGHELTLERRQLFGNLIAANLKKVAEEQGRKSP